MSKLARAVLCLALCVLTNAQSFDLMPSPMVDNIALSLNSTLKDMLPASIRDAGMIRVGADFTTPSIVHNSNGQLGGLDVDLASALSQILGVTFNFTNVPIPAIFDSLLAGKYDILMNTLRDRVDRQARGIDFVDYLTAGAGLIVPTGNPMNIKSLLDLCGKRVAGGNAFTQTDQLKGVLSQNCSNNSLPNITVLGFPTEADTVDAVLNGTADASYIPSPGDVYFANLNSSAVERVVFPDMPAGVLPLTVGMAMRKNSPELLAAMYGAMGQLMDSGAYTAILGRWNLTDFANTNRTIDLQSADSILKPAPPMPSAMANAVPRV